MKEKLIVTIGAILLYGGAYLAFGFAGSAGPWKIPAICYLSLLGVLHLWVIWKEGKLAAVIVGAVIILAVLGLYESLTPPADHEEIVEERFDDWSDGARFERGP